MTAASRFWEASLGHRVVALLLLPVVLLLLVVTADIARWCLAYVRLGNAARAAARYGSLHPEDAGEIAARVKRAASGPDLAVGLVMIACPHGGTSGCPLEVDVHAYLTTVLGSALKRPPLGIGRDAAAVIV